MIENFACFMPLCKNKVSLSCTCEFPEIVMCEEHKNNHLKAKKLHKIKSISEEKVKFMEYFNEKKSLMIEMKNLLTESFKKSPEEILEIKLHELEKGISRIEKLISDFKNGEIYIENETSADEIIRRKVNKNKDYLADLIMKDKKLQMQKFIKKYSSSIINEANEYNQAQADLLKLSFFDQYDAYIISITDSNRAISVSHTNFLKKCKQIQSMLDKIIFKIHNHRCNDLQIIDFNYLYNIIETINGGELWVYDIESCQITSTIVVQVRCCYQRLLDQITNLIKISNSSLLIIGTLNTNFNVLLIDLHTKAIREMFFLDSFIQYFRANSEFILYGNYLFQFGNLWSSGCMKYDIIKKIWHSMPFPQLSDKLNSVLYKSYILISNYINCNLYLYDLIIEEYSVLSSFEDSEGQKFLFTDNTRVYLWIKNSNIYESEENNPFEWNIIGNLDFGINEMPHEITFSNYLGSIYASFVIRQHMFCYRLNKGKRIMELIKEKSCW